MSSATATATVTETTPAVRFVVQDWAGNRIAAHDAIAEKFGFTDGGDMFFDSQDDAWTYIYSLCEVLCAEEGIAEDHPDYEKYPCEFATYMVDAEGCILDDEEAEIAYTMLENGDTQEEIAAALAPFAVAKAEQERIEAIERVESRKQILAWSIQEFGTDPANNSWLSLSRIYV